jgi:hypothetical protein
MKKSILITIITLVAISSYAQKRNELMGPAYKNYKPWMHENEPDIVYTIEKKENLTGPKYKNKKAWDKSNEAGRTPVVFGSDRSKLSGPEYKNYKPWRKNEKED